MQLLEAQKQSLELSCRDLDVRIGEKRDNIGDALSEDSNEVLERNLLEFDRKVNLIVSPSRLLLCVETVYSPVDNMLLTPNDAGLSLQRWYVCCS